MIKRLEWIALSVYLCAACVPDTSPDKPLDRSKPLLDSDVMRTVDNDAPSWPEGAALSTRIVELWVTLTWSQATDATAVDAYLLYQDGTLIAVLPGDVNALQVGPLTSNQNYRFTVQARDPSGNESDDGPGTELQIDDQTPPTFGDSGTLAIQQISGTAISLEWSEALDDVRVNEYHIYQDHELIGSVDGERREFSVDGLAEGVDYLFGVQAVDAALNASTDGPAMIYRLSDQTAPLWPDQASLRATDIAESSLWLRWDEAQDTVGIHRYRVRQDEVEIALLPHDRPYLFIQGLRAHRTYIFDVTAEDLMGQSTSMALSLSVETPDLSPPTWSATASLSPSMTTGDAVTLTWSGASDLGEIVSYTVYQDNLEVQRIEAPSTEATVGDLRALIDYSFRVEATDSVGHHSNGGPSVTVRLADILEPVWPEDAALIASEIEPTSARLTWSPASDNVGVARYEIESEGVILGESSGALLSTTVTDLVPHATTPLTVYAIDGAGHRSRGPTFTLETPNFDRPEWPDGVTVVASELTTTSVRLHWTALPADPTISDYVIYQNDLLVEHVAHPTASVELLNLLPAATTTLRVELRGPTQLESENGPQVEVITPAIEASEWPENAALNAADIGETSLSLSWSAVLLEEQAVHYEIYQDDRSLGTVLPPQRSFVVEDLQAATTYHFHVDVLGIGEVNPIAGPALSVTTIDATPPFWPAGAVITVNDVDTQSIELSWTPAQDNVGVVAYRVHSDPELIWETDQPNLTANDLRAATSYEFSVYALDAAGHESPLALSVSAETEGVPGLNDQEVYDGLRPHCAGCHALGDSAYFASFEDFQSRVVDVRRLITPGDPDQSFFIRVLEGNGTAPWVSMPLGNRNYQQMTLLDNTLIDMDSLRSWVLLKGGN